MNFLRAAIAAAFLGWAATAAGQQPPPEPTFPVTGFLVEGDNPLSQEDAQRILEPFKGDAVTLARLQEASDALEQAVRGRGYAFHRVTLPPQTATGVITLKVVKFRLHEVKVKGNKRFSEENVMRALPSLRAESTPNSRELARELALANDHPAKQYTVVFRESDKPDTINADVEVRERRPWQLYTAVNNTGTKDTGWWRLSLGFQHANLFDRDQALTVSYTTSPEEWRNVAQYGLFYTIPIYPLSGQVALFASKSNVDSGTVAGGLNVSGAGSFMGAGYTQKLLPIDDYSHDLEVLVQDRLFDSSVGVGGPTIDTKVRSRPLSLGYRGKLTQVWGTASFTGDWVVNLPVGNHNTDLDYTLSRPGSRPEWDAWRYGGSVYYLLPRGFMLAARFLGQTSLEPLIAGEQFGIGGANSVRGFEEREISGDSGYSLNLEAWSPPFFEGMRAIAFFDSGAVRDRTPAPIPNINISSTGVGLRYAWKESLSVQVDAAYVLDGDATPGSPGTTNKGDHKVHATIFYRF